MESVSERCSCGSRQARSGFRAAARLSRRCFPQPHSDLPFRSVIMTSASATWKIVSSSVTGTSHAKTGLPCQDAHGGLTLPDGTLLFAVADGAGSASRADHGSQIAAKDALEFLK